MSQPVNQSEKEKPPLLAAPVSPRLQSIADWSYSPSRVMELLGGPGAAKLAKPDPFLEQQLKKDAS